MTQKTDFTFSPAMKEHINYLLGKLKDAKQEAQKLMEQAEATVAGPNEALQAFIIYSKSEMGVPPTGFVLKEDLSGFVFQATALPKNVVEINNPHQSGQKEKPQSKDRLIDFIDSPKE